MVIFFNKMTYPPPPSPPPVLFNFHFLMKASFRPYENLFCLKWGKIKIKPNPPPFSFIGKRGIGCSWPPNIPPIRDGGEEGAMGGGGFGNEGEGPPFHFDFFF
nr:hypothetical protein [Morchella crassipes]